MMRLWEIKDLPKLPSLRLAVVGHVEWVTFLKLENLPKAGIILHADKFLEEPAGGGALAAVQMANLTKQRVDFFTSLGKDFYGESSLNRLESLGLKVNVAWRDKPTRRGISIVDKNSDRAITVIGERLQPNCEDNLDWEKLCNYHGVFVTATDPESLEKCRYAKVLVATPRIGKSVIENSKVKLDALIGSGLDPDEAININKLLNPPKLVISTEGELGGVASPGGRFKAVKLKKPALDSYGCGDSFAAGVTIGLAAGWDIEKSISLGAHCGAICGTYFGPYLDPTKNLLSLN